jgi:hypothetical protein
MELTFELRTRNCIFSNSAQGFGSGVLGFIPGTKKERSKGWEKHRGEAPHQERRARMGS